MSSDSSTGASTGSTGSTGSAAKSGSGSARGSGGSGGSGADSREHEMESIVCFVVGGRSYAVDVSLVREVVNVGTVFPVPKTPSPVAGVFSLRGATVALVDTSRLLGLAASAPDTQPVALILVRNHQTICGLTIDRVIGVTRFVVSHFIPANPEREPDEVIGFMPDERGGLLTVLDSTVIINALNRLRFR